MIAHGQLDAVARACRGQIIRMLTHAGSGHPGGSLSVIDLLAIMFGRLHHDPDGPTGSTASALHGHGPGGLLSGGAFPTHEEDTP